MTASKNIQKAIEDFHSHYQQRFGKTTLHTEILDKNKTRCYINSNQLKKGNEPRIFHHGKVSSDVIILTHGLSDSPYYLEAVAKRFFNIGLNVVMPLLPAHGLKDPDKAMQDFELDTKWREEIDAAVNVAAQFGNRISVGGFSTGGALSYNKILRNPNLIQGGLFLFSGAIDVKMVKEASRFSFLQSITKMTDGVIHGIGRDPYKYPNFPNFGALELGQVIRENQSLSKNKKISQPVFAAHSVHDESARVDGIVQLMEENVEKGLAYLISENVAHSELPLDAPIPLNTRQKEGPETAPKANPRFDDMMEVCLRFFRTEVKNKG
jgi:esterase/lipase